MLEAAVVIDHQGQPIYWHTPSDREFGGLPDSQKLWDFLWERLDARGIAHSHPGSGMPGPSWEDLTTFAAVELVLGRLDWWITSSNHVALFRWAGPGKFTYKGKLMVDEPSWTKELRRLSV